MTEPIAEARWFPELNDSFEEICSDRVFGRSITKYALRTPASIEMTERVMRAFLAAHSELFSCFPVDRFREEIEAKPYVVINGNAVCLAEDCYIIPEVGDCLSGGLAERPVKCTEGHILDASRIRFWIERNGDHCPVPPEHALGPLQVDGEVMHEVLLYQSYEQGKRGRRRELCQNRKRWEELERNQDELEERFERTKQFSMRKWKDLADTQTELGSQITIRVVAYQQEKECIAGTARAVIDVAAGVGTDLFWGTVKKAAAVGFTLGTRAASIPEISTYGLPLFSVVLSLKTGIYRFFEGRWMQVVGQVLSGAAGCVSLIPGVGTAVSFGAVILADVLGMAIDVHEIVTAKDRQNAIYADLRSLYRILGLDPDQNPTREQVDEAYRRQIELVRPRQLRGSEVIPAGSITNPEQLISRIKDRIYQLNRWE